MVTPTTQQEVRFDDYTLELRTGELRRNGVILKLQPQPAKVLSILVARAGEVVSRQELTDQVWGSETYVDFEHGLNYAIQQIRSVLQDDPKVPRFLETVPKRGYRFVASVVGPGVAGQAQSQGEVPVTVLPSRMPRRKVLYSAAALAFAMIIGLTWYLRSSNVRRQSTSEIRSVAVLPLRNLSNDPNQEYFSDGMTDELITDLAKAGGLRVISHTSVERFKNTKTPLSEIAKQLGVDAIVEGTVMRSAERVRITAQLIDARSDQHLWAQSYERNLRDVFKLQDEVAQRIVSEIGTSLIADHQPVATRSEMNSEAHEAYLRGNFYWNELNCESFNKARQFFEKAVGQDPGFARAYVGLAKTYFTLRDWGCAHEPDLIAKSKTAAEKALELDPSLGEAHAWLGKLAFFYEWDFREAEHELKRATELSPNYAEAHIVNAVFLVVTGNREAGLSEIKTAHDIDPISQLTNVIHVVVLYFARDYDGSIEQAKKTLELYPQSWGATIWVGAAYEKKRLYEQALSSYLKAKELSGVPPNQLSAWRNRYHIAGIHGYWQKELEDAEKKGTATPCWFANTYGHLGDEKKALEFLDRSLQEHCPSPLLLFGDPVFDDFRDEPAFQELVRRLPQT